MHFPIIIIIITMLQVDGTARDIKVPIAAST